jgi:hypothetical protein
MRNLQWLAVALTFAAATAATKAEARPTYFQVLTERYNIQPGDRTYACGNCHFLWTGTGARNPYGSAVEQQLYVGKSIDQALQDVEAMDSDGDGFTNLDELLTYRTLPGYSCDNFFLAEGAPAGYDTFITPLVPSCLQPKDVRVDPTTTAFVTKAGTTEVHQIQVINNGSTDVINVSSYGFLSGASSTLSVSGPTAPFDIPVGQSVTLDVTFSPPAAVIALGTLRIASDDPDEPTIDVSVQGFGVVQVLAAADARERCLKVVDKEFRRYADRHRREWNRCFVDEVRGIACDAGARDLKIQQAESRLLDAVGGAKDKVCAGKNLTPSLLGLPGTCGGSCNIILNGMADLSNCLVCQEDAARDEMLRAGIGTAPPDSPPNVAGTSAADKCQKDIATRLAKGISNVQKLLGRCEIANISAATPAECSSTNASAIADVQAQVNEAGNRCKDSTGLLGCLFEGGTATCLGDAAESIGTDLVGTTFGVTP